MAVQSAPYNFNMPSLTKCSYCHAVEVVVKEEVSSQVGTEDSLSSGQELEGILSDAGKPMKQ
eukprot:6019045-Karenia_brevis.AAC.1